MPPGDRTATYVRGVLLILPIVLAGAWVPGWQQVFSQTTLLDGLGMLLTTLPIYAGVALLGLLLGFVRIRLDPAPPDL
jgi:hypothetical protein